MIQQSTFGYLSKENENTNLKRHAHPMFTAASLTIVKIWKQPKYPQPNEWIKMRYIHIIQLLLSDKISCHLWCHGPRGYDAK